MKSDSTGQLALSIGVLLSTERENKGIPIERAAKETRMRAQRIRDMENDDLSSFTNPSYARMFIVAYAKYLGLPMDKVRELLPDPGEVASEGYAYTRYTQSDLPPLRPDLVNRSKRGRLLPTVVGIVAVLVLAALGFLLYTVAINVTRLREDQAKKDATPVPVQRLESAEEALASSDPTTLEIRGYELSATVSPTPSGNPLVQTLEETVVILPGEPARSEDLSTDETSTLEASIPAPEADPVAPAIPISDPIEEADRAFLLQTTAPE